MKLRIKGNTIRLRLSQGDLEQFEREGAVSESTTFDPEGRQQLIYALEVGAEGEVPVASFSKNTITIKVPDSLASVWIQTNQVGFTNNVDPERTVAGKPYILVEKDFQCLHKRPHEDESDNFPNPLAPKNS
jgi:Family of unknown function (DUF7009)